MTDTLGKIKNFVNYVRHTLKGDEKGEDQFFYEALFKAFGHKGCREAGAQTQFRVKSSGQHTKFADLVWRPRLLLEMKSRGEKLEKHHQQVFEYWDKLIPQPRYVVLCNFDEFWIYDTTLQIEEPVNRVKLEELPQRYAALNFLFPGNSAVDEHRGNYHENIPPSGAVQLFGRDRELERLHQLLTPPAVLIQGGEQQNKLTIAAIVGMGGVGKTELAIQYARHHLQGFGDGAGGVCWVDARDGDVGIQVVNFARSLLNLNPPEDWDLPTQLNYCWRNWQKGDWLIVIDDVTNYRQQVNPYKPPESSRFKVLLTTREELGRPVEHLPLDKLQPEAALDLLTSLVGVQRIQQESDIAEQLCQWLDYLPLGLELVGRYLERDPDLSLKAMLSRLEKKRLRHRSVLEADSTMTARLGVADAFELSWERLDEDAQFLGCLLSLFASADIPWDLVKQAYSNMPSSENEEIELDILEEARADLVRFNLLQRTGEETYRLHQLIREFLRDKREQSAQVNDLKQGFLAAIVAVAKQISESPTRQRLQELAPAVPHMAELGKYKDCRDFNNKVLIIAFTGLGQFYKAQGLYEQAEPWFKQCLSITQSCFGSDHSYVAISQHNLAKLYCRQGLYREAELRCLEALKLAQQPPEEDCSTIVTYLNTLASIYYFQGRYNEAELRGLEALGLCKRFHKKDDLTTALSSLASSLSKLALIYEAQGRYSEAKPLYLKAFGLQERLLGAKDPNAAVELTTLMNNLGLLYAAQGDYSEAESLYLQTLKLQKCILGEDHPDVAFCLNNLAELYHAQGRYSEAEHQHQQALELRQRLLGKTHPNVGQSLNNLALLYYAQKRYRKAERLCLQALKIYQSLPGDDHPDVATTLNNLAMIHEAQGRYQEAEPLYMQALELKRRWLGENHRDIAASLNNLAGLHLKQGRYKDAEPLSMQALEIDKRLLGDNHDEVATDLHNLAMLYFMQKRFNKAEPLLLQALEIRQERLGLDHPHTINSRNALAMLPNDLNSTARNFPNFNQKAKKCNSKKKPKGFGKV
ncbi:MULTISPECIES: tetratricopeptide repeat protein [Cyanophyceae]|uniref:tetratricopeptide repeat protein n=1 Tax=Cyanophyceae TaxID=3028117 RepID=UPI0018EF948D|nr:tetratricopeptide repeat protein [Trichocoleus sp. FACHB-69]